MSGYLHPDLDARRAQILQLLREGVSAERVIRIGAHRGTWAAADVMNAVAQEQHRDAMARNAKLEHGITEWAPPSPAGKPATVLLTGREADVLTLLCEGVVRNADIAARLGVSQKAVEKYLTRMYAAVGARDKCEAVALALTYAVRIHVKPRWKAAA